MSRDWTGNGRAAIACVAPSNQALGERAEHDFYATDPKVVELLMGLESFSCRVWEPACGAGHISNVLRAHGHEVTETDIIDRCGNGVRDFLNGQPTVFDGDIITNPPYSKATEFVSRAMESVSDGHKVAFLLKLTFLESKKRHALFEKYPPRRIWVSRNRLSCWKNGVPIRGTLIAYAWFIWEKGWKGAPEIRWFN